MYSSFSDKTMKFTMIMSKKYLTIVQPVLAFKQISAHSGRILLCSQRILDAVD